MEEAQTPITNANPLPDAVQDYVFGLDVVDQMNVLAESLGLQESVVVPLLRMLPAFVLEHKPLADLPGLLVEAGVPEAKKAEASKAFADQILRPIAEAVGDIDAAIRSWGGEAAPAPVKEQKVQEPKKIQNEKIQEPNKIQSEEKPTEQKPVVQKPPAPAPVAAPVPKPAPKPIPKDALEPAEETELKTYVEKAKQAEAMAAPALSGMPKLVADVVAVAALKDKDAQTRLSRLVEARLRDVRDAYGTRAELEKPAAAGGVGLSGRALADVMEKIESAVDASKASSVTKLAQDKTDLIEKGRAREQAQGDVRQKEEQLLARRYAELTGKAPTQPIGATGARASVAIPAGESIAQAARRIDAGKVKQAVEAARPAPPAAPVARPQMRDVQPVRRLASPTDELRALSLVDFRRLSKDPKAAAEKVMDKIDLLEKDGYDQRLAAVKAWRDSPLNRWYVATVQEAMSRGLTVNALLAEKRAGGSDVPTDAEMQAVVGLNGRLRF